MVRARTRGSCLVLAGALSALLLAGAPSWAASFTVNSTADEVDANPGDGVCETAPGVGVCTLRAAILEANALAGADRIVLPAGTYTLTRDRDVFSFPDTPEDLDLDVTGDLEIMGAGAATTVIKTPAQCVLLTRILDIGAVTASISGVTVRDGCPPGDGGGIYNAGVLTLTDVIVTHNVTPTFGPSATWKGGGIRNDGTLTLTRGSVTDNHVLGGYFAAGYGGGIFNAGTLAIEDSTVSANDAPVGGGIDSSGTLTIVNGTITGNTAIGIGDLIFHGDVEPVGTCGGRGGGIRGSATLRNSTVAYNVSLPGDLLIPPIDCFPGDGAGLSGSITLQSTIVHNPSSGGDCTSPVASNGHNIAGDGSCALAGAGDQNGTDPLLGPLADNGGPTQTHALLAGSPAIDAGDAGACPSADQRGVPRPQGAGCDVGSFETTGLCGNGALDPGEGCDDGNPFDGDCCSATCQLEAAGSPCRDDGNICTDDRCDATGSCQHPNNTAPCDDGDLCTAGESCTGGVCVEQACQDAAPRRARLSIRNDVDDTRDAFTWKWKSSGTVAREDFGDPTVSTGYILCLVGKLGLPAAGTCGGDPCWTSTKGGFRFFDPSYPPAGTLKASLKSGAPQKGTIVVQRRQGSIDVMPPVPTPVTVRLLRTDAPVCWESRFSQPTRNESGQFKAKSD